MGSRSTRTASGARAFELLSHPDIGIEQLARDLAALRRASRRRSPSSSRSTPNTTSICPARPPTSRPIAATKAWSCPTSSTTPQLPGLSNEVRQKLQSMRPRTIGQAGRIDGITPAALTLLVAHLKRTAGRAPSGTSRKLTRRAPRGSTPPMTVHAVACRTLPPIARARCALTPVSRETFARLDRFVELLLTWQRTTNLIAPSTVPRLWTRHIADSLQLLDLAPGARVWVDLGSGGGFPGLVIACALADTPGRGGSSGRKQRQKGRLPARGQRASPARRPWCMRADRKFRGQLPGSGRRRHGARAGAVKKAFRSKRSAVENRRRSGCSRRDKM